MLVLLFSMAMLRCLAALRACAPLGSTRSGCEGSRCNFFFFGGAALVRVLKNISDNGNTGPKLALLSALGLFIYLFIIFISQNSKLPSYLK